MTTPNIGLTEVPQNSTQVAYPINASERVLDALVQLAIETTANTPPTTIAGDAGKRWIVGTSPTGAWLTHSGKIAHCVGANLWQFLSPKEGWAAYDRGVDVWRDYNGTAWEQRNSARGGEFAGLITGLAMRWVSSTSITITNGAAHIESLARSVSVPTAITKSGLSLSANTWYHVYLFLIAGSVDVEIVTTAPAAAYSGTACSKSGDTSRRYLGSVRAGAGGSIINFNQTGNQITYLVDNLTAVPNRVLAGGSATARTTVDLSAAVPQTSKLAYLSMVNIDATQPFRIDNSETGNTGTTTGLVGIGAGGRLFANIPCDASQDIIYYYPAAPSGGNAFIDVLGYIFER